MHPLCTARVCAHFPDQEIRPSPRGPGWPLHLQLFPSAVPSSRLFLVQAVPTLSLVSRASVLGLWLGQLWPRPGPVGREVGAALVSLGQFLTPGPGWKGLVWLTGLVAAMAGWWVVRAQLPKESVQFVLMQPPAQSGSL